MTKKMYVDVFVFLLLNIYRSHPSRKFGNCARFPMIRFWAKILSFFFHIKRFKCSYSKNTAMDWTCTKKTNKQHHQGISEMDSRRQKKARSSKDHLEKDCRVKIERNGPDMERAG